MANKEDKLTRSVVIEEFKPVPKNNLFYYGKSKVGKTNIVIIVDIVQRHYTIFIKNSDKYYLLSANALTINKNGNVFDLDALLKEQFAFMLSPSILSSPSSGLIQFICSIKLIDKVGDLVKFESNVYSAWEDHKYRFSYAARSAIKYITGLE